MCQRNYRFPLMYGTPDAFGAVAFPINPANAKIVNTYGKIVKNTGGIS